MVKLAFCSPPYPHSESQLTGQSVVATAPYPVELTVELRIEQEDVASVLHYPLKAKTRASKVVLCRQGCSCAAFATQQTLWIGNTVYLPTEVRVINLAMGSEPYVGGC